MKSPCTIFWKIHYQNVFFFLDKNGKLIHMNTALAEMIPVQPGDAIGMKYDEVLSGINITTDIIENQTEALMLGSDVMVGHSGMSGDKNMVWNTHLIPFMGKSGHLKGIVGISNAVTPPKGKK